MNLPDNDPEILEIQNITRKCKLYSWFLLSIFASGILYLLNKKIAYYMYFPQFVLRLLFVMPTFGIILFPVKYNAGSTLYKVLLAVCIILEIGRFAATIFCLIKDRKSSTI